MPETSVGVLFVVLAMRKTDKFQLHTPRGKKIDPSLTTTRPGGSNRRLSQNLHTFRLQVRNSLVNVFNVKRQMVSTDIAVARRRHILVGRFVFEYLEVRTEPTAKKAEPFHDGARMNIEMGLHPVVVGLEGSKFVEGFTSDHIHKKIRRLFEIRNGKSDVVSTPKPRQPVGSICKHFSSSLFFPAAQQAGIKLESVQSPCQVMQEERKPGIAITRNTSVLPRRQCGH